MQALQLVKALAEPLRLRILVLLNQASLTVGELVEILEVSQSNVSHHLRFLREWNFVGSSRTGTTHIYKLLSQEELPPYARELWQNLPDLAKELSTYQQDQFALLNVLSRREKSGSSAAFRSSREFQPDLPYTEQFARLGVKPSGRALDAGCGDGNFLPILCELFLEVVGLDSSLAALATAPTDKRVSLVNGDAQTLPFSLNCFDAIYFRMSLQFLPAPELALERALECLKPTGIIAVIDSRENQQAIDYDFFMNFTRRYSQTQLRTYQAKNSIFLAALEKMPE